MEDTLLLPRTPGRTLPSNANPNPNLYPKPQPLPPNPNLYPPTPNPTPNPSPKPNPSRNQASAVEADDCFTTLTFSTAAIAGWPLPLDGNKTYVLKEANLNPTQPEPEPEP